MNEVEDPPRQPCMCNQCKDPKEFVNRFYTFLFEKRQNSDAVIQEKREWFTKEFLEAYEKEMKRFEKASYVYNPDGAQRFMPDGTPERELPAEGLNYNPFTWAQDMLDQFKVLSSSPNPKNPQEEIVQVELVSGPDKKIASIFLEKRIRSGGVPPTWAIANAQADDGEDLMASFEKWSKK